MNKWGIDALPRYHPRIYDSRYHKFVMASGEMLDGYVVAADVTPSKDPALDASLTDNNKVALTASKQNTYDIVFTIEANVKNAVTNELGTQEIRVGKTHIVKTAQFELDNGVILSLKTE